MKFPSWQRIKTHFRHFGKKNYLHFIKYILQIHYKKNYIFIILLNTFLESFLDFFILLNSLFSSLKRFHISFSFTLDSSCFLFFNSLFFLATSPHSWFLFSNLPFTSFSLTLLKSSTLIGFCS